LELKLTAIPAAAAPLAPGGGGGSGESGGAAEELELRAAEELELRDTAGGQGAVRTRTRREKQ
jgi:hypothetical protein